VHPVAALALEGDAGPVHLRKAVGVVDFDAEEGFDLLRVSSV